MILDGAKFDRPRSLDEACARVASLVKSGTPFHVLAGGTDLIVESHLTEPTAEQGPGRTILDISSLPELAIVEDRGDRIRLGGGVTYLTLRRPPLAERLPLLALMSKDVGAIQIQARGTLAGNLATASPAADGVCGLFPLDAMIGLRSAEGERTIPLVELYTGYKKTQRRPDELIAWIDVRVPKPGAHWIWRKVGTRLAQAISKVALAAVCEVESQTITYARFGMASVAPTTVSLASVQALLEGKRVDAIDLSAVERAVDKDVAPIDDVRSTGAYRRHVACAVVRELVRSLNQPRA
jgi:CO/xanthine dehydrogenase FAD-binding subunit